jgi:excisionase family DNA binding protein
MQTIHLNKGNVDSKATALQEDADHGSVVPYGTPLAQQLESFFRLLPRELMNHPNAPKSSSEMTGKLLAAPLAQVATPAQLESFGRMLTVKETASRLRCCRKSVFLKIKHGELQALKSGRVVRVPETAILALLSGGSQAVAK